ncbi:Glycerophosphoryl diester phosphodiesterase [Piscirickettsia salmonis]|uniref:glycerophosphodiester phosphodiesterase family protein n=1 Tax=Piscirickettsia salmonis TaxID=1238 RepID=UPI0012B714D7|nr:glycerophosphodiester phosphodiesterase family protein [Piscirickettsia salmonis]QGP51764.1 Glycerophosphoryl diester phosphodiesterase [Piscirickettsia salmonis]
MNFSFDLANDCVQVIAHRGASAEYPENTWMAFEHAHAQGAKWLEFDVWVNADGVPVIFHDESLERMTNGVGHITEASSAYLSSLHIKHQGQLLENEKIPHLETVLAWLDKCQLSANIELKGIEKKIASCSTLPLDLKATAKIICAVINKFPSLRASLVISSFSLSLLAAARNELPHYALGLLVDNCLSTHTQGLAVEESQRYLAIFKQLDCYSLHVNQNGLDQQCVRYLKRLFNCPLLSYTVNDCERAKMLLAWGVDAVFSDYPKLLYNISY